MGGAARQANRPPDIDIEIGVGRGGVSAVCS